MLPLLCGLVAGCMTVAGVLLCCGIKAEYGRYASDTAWSIDAKIGWLVQESPSFLISFGYLVKNRLILTDTNAISLGFFCWHYFYRSCIYPTIFVSRKSKKMPLYIVLAAFLFTTINGYIISSELSHLQPRTTRLPFTIGMLVALTGHLIVVHSDFYLTSLRRTDGGYKIPMRGLFQYVSCANYFGECVEWIGFAIATQTIGSATFAYATLANLIPRAIAHDKWYRKQFKDYPKDRLVIIPFIFYSSASVSTFSSVSSEDSRTWCIANSN